MLQNKIYQINAYVKRLFSSCLYLFKWNKVEITTFDFFSSWCNYKKINSYVCPLVQNKEEKKWWKMAKKEKLVLCKFLMARSWLYGILKCPSKLGEFERLGYQYAWPQFLAVQGVSNLTNVNLIIFPMLMLKWVSF